MGRIVTFGESSVASARYRALSCFTAVVAATALGCSAEVGSEEEAASSEVAIIGGSVLPVVDQRSMGIVRVNGNRCSGALLTPHWAITATHCVDLVVAGNNHVRMARTDGGEDDRQVTAVSQVAQTDITILQLGPTSPGMMWPVALPTRTMVPSSTNVVNQNVTCYGQGATAYASPSGVTGAGPWRSLVRKVTSDDGFNRYVQSDNGNNILAPGDSGGACFLGSQIAGIVSFSNDLDCADRTTDFACKQTITKIFSSALASTTLHANYVNMAPARTGTATFRPLALGADWTPAFNTNRPSAAVVDGTVHLRGAMKTTGTNAIAFTLPVGYRPGTDVYVPINLCHAAKGRLFIRPSGVTTIQTDFSTPWANAQCLTSLDGASFLISSVFTPLVLQNDWINAPYGTRNAAVRLSQGIVQFRGAVADGSSSLVFTLPAQYRPPTEVYVNVDMCDATKGRLNIAPTGEVTIHAEDGRFDMAQCFTSLEGVSFPLSAVAWTSMTPLNGWTSAPFSTRAPAATNLGGVIRLQGAVATFGMDQHAFTLPQQMRPAGLVSVPIDLCGGDKGNLVIQEDGRAFVLTSEPWSTVRCFASLEGLTYGL